MRNLNIFRVPLGLRESVSSRPIFPTQVQSYQRDEKAPGGPKYCGNTSARDSPYAGMISVYEGSLDNNLSLVSSPSGGRGFPDYVEGVFVATILTEESVYITHFRYHAEQVSALRARWRKVNTNEKHGSLPSSLIHTYLFIIMALIDAETCPKFFRLNRIKMVGGGGLLALTPHLKPGAR